MAITIAHILDGVDNDIPLRITGGSRNDDLRHFSAIGPRIHISSSANTARNAAGKFHAGETILQCFPCGSCRRHSARDRQEILLPFHAVQTTGEYHRPSDAFVPDEQVRPAAQYEKRHRMLVCELCDEAHFFCRFRHQKTICRPTNAKGGMTLHGFICLYLILS